MTNISFVKKLMEGTLPLGNCPAGALVQPFILEALDYYSSKVIEAGPEASDASFLNGAAWVATAEHVKAAVTQHYKQ